MKPFSLFLLSFIFSLTVYSQTITIHAKSVLYEGTFGKHIIHMTLQYGDNVVTGFYEFMDADTVDPVFIYYGKPDSVIKLYSSNEQGKSGVFNAIVNKTNGDISGKWATNDTTYEIPFQLKVVLSRNYIMDYYSGVYKIRKDTLLQVQVQGIRFDKTSIGPGLDSINACGHSDDYDLLKNNKGKLRKKDLKEMVVISDDTAEEDSSDNWISVYDEIDGYTEKTYRTFDWTKFNEIYYWDTNFITIAWYSYEFFGGHGNNSAIEMSTFDLKTGRPVNIDSCFIKGYSEQLDTIINKMYSINVLGFVAIDSSTGHCSMPVDILEPYYFMEKGLQVQVSFLGSRPDFFYVPYTKLLKYIDPKGPLRWVIKG